MTDPTTSAVLQNRLNAIAEEMGEAMLRTACSQILNSSRDFSIAPIDTLPPGCAGRPYSGGCRRDVVGG
jgi:N-methylhydantoinase B/oxoprolinase/acetone carboxylase alpha subunit